MQIQAGKKGLIRMTRVNQDDEDVINHISVLENTNLGRHKTVNPETNTNVTPGGRTQVVSPATAGITSAAVEQLAKEHTLSDKGKQRTTRMSKKPTDYEPNYTTKKYSEGTTNINMDYMKENEPMKDFTIQNQIEHVLGVAMVQVYSLKKGLKEFSQDRKKNSTIIITAPPRHGHIFSKGPKQTNEAAREREALE